MALLIDIARSSIRRGEVSRVFPWYLIEGAAFVLLSVLCMGTSAVAVGEGAQVLEQRVKAAFLFKFGGYVEWPDNVFAHKESPLVIGVAGGGGTGLGPLPGGPAREPNSKSGDVGRAGDRGARAQSSTLCASPPRRPRLHA